MRRGKGSGSSIRFEKNQPLEVDGVLTLYRRVGWTQYAENPDLLMAAIEGCQCVVSAYDGEVLVGLIRCVTDSASVVYIQDLLVDPAYQRQGVGRRLMDVLELEYTHVPLKLLLTDDTAQQSGFYEALHYTNTRTLTVRPLNTFVRISGQTLE